MAELRKEQILTTYCHHFDK